MIFDKFRAKRREKAAAEETARLAEMEKEEQARRAREQLVELILKKGTLELKAGRILTRSDADGYPRNWAIRIPAGSVRVVDWLLRGDGLDRAGAVAIQFKATDPDGISRWEEHVVSFNDLVRAAKQ